MGVALLGGGNNEGRDRFGERIGREEDEGFSGAEGLLERI